MNILLSAYACQPGKGSEPGVGWNWALEALHSGHQIWVMTRANNRPSIEAKLSSMPKMKNLNFIFYDIPYWLSWWKKGQKRIRVYYFFWQWGAYQLAKKIHEDIKFDLAHHITFVSVRQPSFMGGLGIPFIFGPTGGGEKAPWSLRYSFGIRGLINDLFRDIANFIIKIDPFMWKTFKQADIIYVTNEQTKPVIPRRFQKKVHVKMAVGIRMNNCSIKSEKERILNFLYVGRFIYWKGMHLGIESFARLLKSKPESRLTMIGEGSYEKKWKSLALKLGVYKNIDWVPWMEKSELYKMYSKHDVFLFPSLHDSGGQVVLEAMAHGLPVVCFNVGGPGAIVNKYCGYKLNVEDLGRDQIIESLGNALVKLTKNKKLYAKLSNGALKRSEEFEWSAVVNDFYDNFAVNYY